MTPPISDRCGGCGRPAADDAATCLYCGAPRRPPDAPPTGRRRNPRHVVWVPSDDAMRDAARLEALLQADPYEARLLVRGATPRVLRTFGAARAAQEMVDRAVRMGLRAFVVDDQTLDSHPPVVPATGAAATPDGLVLCTASGPVPLAAGKVDLLVAARVPVRRRRTVRRVSMLSLQGGTPGLPRVVTHTRTTADHPGVLDVYPAGESRCVRVREESTDFSGLREPGHLSALLHFTRLVARARVAAPDAVFDDRFARFDDNDPARPGRIDAGPAVAILDGVERFGRYSRLLWMSHRLLRNEEGSAG